LFPRHSLTVISVLGFHLAIIAVLLLGLGGKIQHLATPRLEIQQITNPERPPPRGDLPRPELIHKAFPIPLPDDPRLPDTNDDRRINAAPTDGSAQAGEESAGAQVLSHAHAVSRVGGGPGTGFPNTDDFYPSLSKFRGEQGIVTVHVCVDASGRLTGEPTLAESSGVWRLDAGALRLAKAGSGHYRASTEDGSPVNSCYLFRVHFRLEN
jgi:TonB family protein